MIQARRNIFQTLINEPITFLGGLLYFLMMFSPAYNVVLKIILIVFLSGIIIFSRIAFDKLNITKPVLTWYVIFILHGIFFTILGFLYGNNTTYVLRTTTYNIFWPFLYLLFTVGIYKLSSLRFFVKVILFANFLIALYLIGSILTIVGVLPGNPVVTFEMSKLSFDSLAGLAKIESPAVICLMFTLPFIISLSFIATKQNFGLNRLFLNINILISIVAVIATARRALILNIILGFIFTIILVKITPTLNQKLFNKRIFSVLIIGSIFIVIGAIIFQSLGIFDLSIVFEKFMSAFSSKENLKDASTLTRYTQFDSLIKSWLQKPWFGFGNGAVSEYVVRSKTTPWVYELTYVALLFQTGIIGAVIYILLLIWPIIKSIQLLKLPDEQAAVFLIPSIVGCACFLIANGTNPYLISYDYMWALFFPVAIINYYLKQQ
ncbi:MAG: O-antigen ligase family protein [Parafilimonas sp.]|nr:O-antigen ligase family protein [Parafilimonas sp.]